MKLTFFAVSVPPNRKMHMQEGDAVRSGARLRRALARARETWVPGPGPTRVFFQVLFGEISKKQFGFVEKGTGVPRECMVGGTKREADRQFLIVFFFVSFVTEGLQGFKPFDVLLVLQVSRASFFVFDKAC